MNLGPNSVYRVEVMPRAARNLHHIYEVIGASNSSLARKWFDGLEALILSLDKFPWRGNATPEDQNLRQLLYGRRPHIYRVIYAIDDAAKIVSVIHIRHGRRDGFADEDTGQ